MGGCVSVRKISSKKVTDISLKATTMATAAKGITKKPYESVTNKNYNIFGRGSSGNSGCSSSPSSSGFFSNPSTSTSKTHNSGVGTQKLSKKRNKYFLRAHPICDNFGKHKLISNEKPMPLNIPSGYTLRNNSDYSKTFEEGRYVITNNTIKNYSTALISEAAEICTKSLNENTLGKTSTPILKRGVSEEFGYKSDYDKWRNNLISKVPWQIQSNCMDSSNIPWICSDNSNISILTLTFDQDNAEKTMAETFLHSVGEVANAAELMGKTSTPLPSRRIMKTSNITNYSKWLNYLHNSSDCSTNNNFKLEPLLSSTIESTPEISEEWLGGSNGSNGFGVWKGTSFLVEIEETDTVSSISSTDYYKNNEYITETINTTNILNEVGPKIIVRTEEVLIVGLVLMLWIGAIILFFNRWGKIRMLEPYQPKFQQQHRASCLTDTLEAMPTHQRTSTTRMSMGLVTNNVTMPTKCQFAKCKAGIYSKGFKSYTRPRQNSVFVEPSNNKFFMQKPPRKTRSAMDLHSMVFNESAESV